MDTVREFLETSTIHGLSHISKVESKLGKAAWTIIVFASFISAGYLISGSYKDWGDSPVSATISTHPIANLPFPKVTVCPPKGRGGTYSTKIDLFNFVSPFHVFIYGG